MRPDRGRWLIGCSGRSGATKYSMAAGAIKGDPASLVDEASAMSLFGGKRADLD